MKSQLETYALAQYRRVLTQMDRDPHSPTFGCFDRNYWHYKIRDFPSSILQQGIFTIEAARKGRLPGVQPPQSMFDWSLAAINALSRQVNRFGAVDEYYPFEHSYPAAAFGLLAAARVLFDWSREEPYLIDRVAWPGLIRLARHLLGRVESQASNQQAAGLAALALASRIPRFAVAPADVAQKAAAFFATQHEEGWFDEYGGPDFGYLSVTIDALMDYHDATADPVALTAATRALDFLCTMTGCDGRLPSTLNSRNTDYVVPCGIIRMAAVNPNASWLAHQLFDGIGDTANHFLWPTDDRYHSHYIFASVVRSLDYVSEMPPPGPEPRQPDSQWLPGAGYYVVRRPQATIFVAAHKGGLVRVHRPDVDPVADHGWRAISQSGRILTSNWWSHPRLIDRAPDSLSITHSFQSCRFQTPTPTRHVVLRLLSFTLRNRVIPLLKRFLIFRPGQAVGPTFTRSISLLPDRIRIDDRFDNAAGFTLTRSPRQNLRHVASADSFSTEEFTAAVELVRPGPGSSTATREIQL
jgi:hypothetical protein